MKIATFHPLRGLAALLALLASWPALADSGPASPAPVLTPKAVISLKYPNPWDFNRLIALTPDGRYLIDAPGAARHIRVWDWREKSVAKRLLLNEEAPEFNDGKSHTDALPSAGGRELTLSHDGRFMAACTGLTGSEKRIWDLGSAEPLARLTWLLNVAPGIPEEARVTQTCDSLSFSPDGSRLAVAGAGTLYLTEQDWEAHQQANARASDRQMRGIKLTPEDFADLEKGKDESFKSVVALYDTQDWRLVRFLRVRPWEKVRSPVLFTADGKQAIGLAYQYPAVFPKEVINTSGTEKYITNRLIRWDIATGEILASMELPKIFALSSWGVRWSWLPGGREVWWDNWPGRRNEQMVGAWNCAAPVPAFESEQAENCGYLWIVSVLDIETGRRRYLAPVKKNMPQSGGVGEPEQIAYVAARLSPDGRRLALLKKMMWKTASMSGRDPSLERMEMDIYSLPEFRLVGSFARGEEDRYAIGVGDLVFSGDSRWLALQMKNSAWLFDLGDKQ